VNNHKVKGDTEKTGPQREKLRERSKKIKREKNRGKSKEKKAQAGRGHFADFFLLVTRQ
jgi:hypothetical protein